MTLQKPRAIKPEAIQQRKFLNDANGHSHIDLFQNCFTQFLLAHGSQCFAQNRGKTSAAYFGVVSSKTRTKKLVQQGSGTGLIYVNLT